MDGSRIRNRFILVLLSTLVLSGCEHLILNPDQETYVDLRRVADRYASGQLRTSDGEALRYVVFEPSTKVLGTLIQFSDQNRNLTYHFQKVYPLVRQGYRILSFDYRGFGGSTGTPSIAGSIADGRAVMEFSCRKYGSPLAVIGSGRGVAMAFLSLAEASGNCVCGLVVDSGFVSLREILRVGFDSHPVTWWLQWPLAYGLFPELAPDGARLNVEWVLGLHYQGDNVVPIEQGEKLFASLEVANKRFFGIPSERHLVDFRNLPAEAESLRFLRASLASCAQEKNHPGKSGLRK